MEEGEPGTGAGGGKIGDSAGFLLRCSLPLPRVFFHFHGCFHRLAISVLPPQVPVNALRL